MPRWSSRDFCWLVAGVTLSTTLEHAAAREWIWASVDAAIFVLLVLALSRPRPVRSSVTFTFADGETWKVSAGSREMRFENNTFEPGTPEQ